MRRDGRSCDGAKPYNPIQAAARRLRYGAEHASRVHVLDKTRREVGLVCGFLYSVTQLLIDLSAVLSWGLTPVAVAGCLALDYIIAFTCLGLAGVFRDHGKLGMILGGDCTIDATIDLERIRWIVEAARSV